MSVRKPDPCELRGVGMNEVFLGHQNHASAIFQVVLPGECGDLMPVRRIELLVAGDSLFFCQGQSGPLRRRVGISGGTLEWATSLPSGLSSTDKARALRPIAFNLRQHGVKTPHQTGEV